MSGAAAFELGAIDLPNDQIVPVLRPRLPKAEALLPYLQRIDGSRIYSNWGPLVGELERRLLQHFSLPDGALTTASSGTAAIVGAILGTVGRASKAKPIAITSAFTFVATAAAIEQCGFVPFLADVDRQTWMLDPGRLLERLPRSILAQAGLIVPVAPFGRPVPQAPWQEFSRKTGIPVVIDAAACFDVVARQPKVVTGTIPVALSFHATKSFSTAEGGCVIASDTNLVHNCGMALNFGFHEKRESRCASTNGKLSEYHAAIGLAELDAWGDKSQAATAVADAYRSAFSAAGLRRAFFGVPDISAGKALFECDTAEDAASISASLKRHRIDFRHWYGGGLHRHPYLSQAAREELPETENVASRLIGIPMAPDLSGDAIARVVAAVSDGLAG